MLIYSQVAGIAKWSNASDCKSAGFGLRRFDSYSQHQRAFKKIPLFFFHYLGVFFMQINIYFVLMF